MPRKTRLEWKVKTRDIWTEWMDHKRLPNEGLAAARAAREAISTDPEHPRNVARRERDRAIRYLANVGWTKAEIARIYDLTPSGVRRILAK